MTSKYLKLIRLCWVLFSLLSLVQANSGGNNSGSGSGSGRNDSPNGGQRFDREHGGNNVHKSRQGFHSQQGQPSGNGDQAQQQQAYNPGELVTISSAVAVRQPKSISTSSDAVLSTTVIRIPTDISPAFVQSYSIADAVGESYSATPPAVLITDPPPSVSIGSVPISSSASPIFNAATIAQLSSTITRTLSITVTIPALSASAAPELSPDPTTTASAVSAQNLAPLSAQDLAPLPTSPGSTSASAKAGMGIGVTFGILSFASAAGLGFYLWRRRRNTRQLMINDEDSGTSSDSGGFGGVLAISKWKRPSKKEKPDAEWSIESASKVEIVRGANAETLSRGSNANTTTAPPVPDFNTMFPPAVIAGPRGRSPPLRLNNLALTSNPPSLPRVDEYPSPPSSPGGNSLHTQTERKTNSWPLED